MATGTMAQPTKLVLSVLLAMQLAGCANLLPSMKREVTTPWIDFDSAKRSFDQIVPYQTTLHAVHTLGFGPDHVPNMQVLNQAQVVQATLPSPLQDGATVPKGILDCMRAGTACVGYAMEPSRMEYRRVGNFVLDVLNFRRDTVTTGWRFAALIVVIDDTVVYKQWSGQPKIQSTVRRTNPLGPLQSIDDAVSTTP